MQKQQSIEGQQTADSRQETANRIQQQMQMQGHLFELDQ
jgi:hypothetical protein